MTKELIALDDLKYDKYNRCDECYYGCRTDECRKYVSYEIVRQALKEKEKQDELLKIIKVNKVYIPYISSYSNYLEYNDRIKYRFSGYEDMLLEEEEFNLIKEWLEIGDK